MTTLTPAVGERLRTAGEDFSAALAAATCWIARHLLCGAGLGLFGLAVVLTVTAALIGAHELTAGGTSPLLPPEIRLR
ncbi:MAG: hypothetical protein ABIL09_07235 [Gemmatimonadota bacterium]